MSLYASTVTLANDKQKAYEIALRAHRGQVDKGGFNYFLHVKRVALFAVKNIPDETALHDYLWIVGLLHDVMEDSDVMSVGELFAIFGTTVGDAVVAITHAQGERYFEYLTRVNKNHLAAAVKIADLRDNLDINRALAVKRFGSAKDYTRLVDVLFPRYIAALEYLGA